VGRRHRIATVLATRAEPTLDEVESE